MSSGGGLTILLLLTLHGVICHDTMVVTMPGVQPKKVKYILNFLFSLELCVIQEMCLLNSIYNKCISYYFLTE